MATVFLNVQGDGTAYTDAIPPLVDGEEFTIYCIPFEGATLDDVKVWDSYDHAIAITVSQEIHLTYSAAWNNVYVDVYFSGSIIPPDPQPPFTKIWLLAKAAQNWRYK